MNTVAEAVPRGRARALAAIAIGNTLEWYDFVVYAQFAGQIGTNFFPGDDASARLIKAFLAFGVGFLVRPLGAVLLGTYGDRAGRKAALTFTILLMAAGTGIIALSPTYAAIGLGAPLLLLLGRVLQGLSAGGEAGGAAAYLFESANPGQRGRSASWLQASMGMANILGALVAFSVTGLLRAGQVTAWGWRIPFLIGLLIVPAGLFLRRALDETPSFEREISRRRDAPIPPAPLRDMFQHHGRAIAVGSCIAALWATSSYVLVIFLPTYVQRPDTYGFTASQAFGASLIGNILLVACSLVFGHLSERVGRRAVLGLSAGILLVGVMPVFVWLRAVPSTTTLIAVQSAMCVAVAGVGGIAPAALAALFPTRVRTTGIALIYNVAFVLFGGFAPAILTWLTRRPGGALFAPAWYVMLTAIIALIALPFLKSQAAPGVLGN